MKARILGNLLSNSCEASSAEGGFLGQQESAYLQTGKGDFSKFTKVVPRWVLASLTNRFASCFGKAAPMAFQHALSYATPSERGVLQADWRRLKRSASADVFLEPLRRGWFPDRHPQFAGSTSGRLPHSARVRTLSAEPMACQSMKNRRMSAFAPSEPFQ